MTQTKLLVIYGDEHSDTQHAEFMARVHAITYQLGVESLVVREGESADAVLELSARMDNGVRSSTSMFRDGLRRCSASRNARLGSQSSSGSIDYSHLSEAIAKQHDRWEQILKRVEDTSALLYKWDRAGMPAAPVDCGIGVVAQEIKPLAAVEGMALSYCLDPLESAIDCAVRLIADHGGTQLTPRLAAHLDALLAEQLKRVTADE